MHYFGTVNLDMISEFITTGIFFSFLFFLNSKCAMQVHRSQTKPDHQHDLVQTLGMAHTALGASLPPLLVCLFSIQLPALFYFPSQIYWDTRLHSNELTFVCLSYVFCVLDCAGGILEGVNGLHSKWCGLSKLFCLYYWDGLISFFFLMIWSCKTCPAIA